MSTVEEIMSAIEQLSFEERARLARLMHGWEDDDWDRQMIADAKAGKFDKLIAEAKADAKAGRARKSRDFWKCFNRLPAMAQTTARKQFEFFQSDHLHPSLHFKELEPGLWSARVSRNYRALAYREDDTLNWFWIGSHAEYDKLLK
jgi:hypothetical protein